MANAYYSNEETVLERQTEISGEDLERTPEEDVEDVYEIQKCLQYIKENKCKRVGLQFPDSLLIDSSYVSKLLESKSDSKVYILADTSYGHCDIDEVNAKHVNADLIIHYGESSLTQSASIPTIHVFGRHPKKIDVDDVCQAFHNTFPKKTNTRIVFLHHVTCNYIADKITDRLMPEYPYLSVGEINFPNQPGISKEEDSNILKDLCTKSCPGCPCRLNTAGKEKRDGEKAKKSSSESTQSNENDRTIISAINTFSADSHSESIDAAHHNEETNERSEDLKKTQHNDERNDHQPDCKNYVTGFYTIPLETDKDISDYNIFYLGPKGAKSLQNLILEHPSCSVFVYDPNEAGCRKLESNTNRQLMKRFYLVEKAKDAKIVGILVGTMGVSGYLDCLRHMKSIIKAAGKKSFTFVVGKINPEKLANFMEIEIFVLIANPEHNIFDSSNFYRPIVTPYEMEVACNPNRQWDGKYITDFRRIIPGGDDYIEFPSDYDPCKDETSTTMSLITGGIRSHHNIEDSSSSDDKEIALRNEKTDLAIFGANSSAKFLSERSWKGLEKKVGETEVKTAEKGRSGLARSYTHELDF